MYLIANMFYRSIEIQVADKLSFGNKGDTNCPDFKDTFQSRLLYLIASTATFFSVCFRIKRNQEWVGDFQPVKISRMKNADAQ